MEYSRALLAAAPFVTAITTILAAAQNHDSALATPEPACATAPPVPCNGDTCTVTTCSGPENYGVNAPVYPRTCDGDLVLTGAGILWKADQDGTEYAIETDRAPSSLGSSGLSLIESSYETPHFKWNFSFKLGLGHHTTCDG